MNKLKDNPKLKVRLNIAGLFLIPMIVMTIGLISEGQGDQVIVLWLSVLCFIFCAAFVLGMMAQGSKRYGLLFSDKKQKILIVCSLISLFLFLALLGKQKNDIGNYAPIAMGGIAASCFLHACIRNIKQSNVLFGTLYTFAQVMSLLLWGGLYFAIKFAVLAFLHSN